MTAAVVLIEGYTGKLYALKNGMPEKLGHWLEQFNRFQVMCGTGLAKDKFNHLQLFREYEWSQKGTDVPIHYVYTLKLDGSIEVTEERVNYGK